MAQLDVTHFWFTFGSNKSDSAAAFHTVVVAGTTLLPSQATFT